MDNSNGASAAPAESVSVRQRLTCGDTALLHSLSTPGATPTWTEADRLAKQDAEHDVAFAIVNGFLPRPDDVEKLRALYSKRDAYLAEVTR